MRQLEVNQPASLLDEVSVVLSYIDVVEILLEELKYIECTWKTSDANCRTRHIGKSFYSKIPSLDLSS